MLWHQWEVSQDTCSLFLSSDLIRNIHFYANGKLNYHFSRVQTLKEKKKDKLVLSPELRMQIGLCKESLELTFQVLTFCHSLWQRANAQNISYRNSLWWSICIIDLVDKTNLFFFLKGGHLILFCDSLKLLTIL